MKAMLLAAGLGTRLRPLTYELPKPMVPILGRPVMEHIMRLLARHKFDDVIANLHYFPDLIRDTFGDGSGQGIKMVYSYEPELLGTAGGVRNAQEHFGGETFLVISGDALTDIDLTKFYEAHKAKGGIATLALKYVDDPSELGVVILNDDGRIQGFQEKPAPGEELSNLGSCGIYMFEPEIFDYFPEREFVDWAQDVYPTLLDQDVPFYGHEIAEYWNDVGSLEEYRQGNFDALEGKVQVEMPGGGNGASLPGDAEVEGPVFIGEGCEIASGVRLTGPVVIGEHSRIGANSALRDTIVWPRTDVDPGTVLVGGLAGERPLGEKLAG
jgi:mannose-1-phosphate guanylyltransferase/mannose-1-phosphate guanylyltransferase/phosphomannomutase